MIPRTLFHIKLLNIPLRLLGDLVVGALVAQGGLVQIVVGNTVVVGVVGYLVVVLGVV